MKCHIVSSVRMLQLKAVKPKWWLFPYIVYCKFLHFVCLSVRWHACVSICCGMSILESDRSAAGTCTCLCLHALFRNVSAASRFCILRPDVDVWGAAHGPRGTVRKRQPNPEINTPTVKERSYPCLNRDLEPLQALQYTMCFFLLSAPPPPNAESLFHLWTPLANS